MDGMASKNIVVRNNDFLDWMEPVQYREQNSRLFLILLYSKPV